MRILIVKLSAIGDVIHTLPALNALRIHYPAARITWLVEEAASDLVVGHHALDRVLISKRKRWIRGMRSGKIVSNLREMALFVKALRDTRYDMIIDFHGLLKSSLLILMARGKRKIGFGKGMEHMEYSHLFLNERVPGVSMELHALKRQLMLLESLGIRCKKIVYDLPLGDADRRKVRQFLESHDMQPDTPYVVINPGAKWKTKLWHADGFAEVADQITGNYHFPVVFTGSREDRVMVEGIRARMGEASVDLTGKTSLKVLGALLEGARLVISTDTGPMHLAAAMGTPVVALFGPTAPWRTGPYGDAHRIVRVSMDCGPCFKRECETMACMKNISAREVLSAVESLVFDARSCPRAKRNSMRSS